MRLPTILIALAMGLTLSPLPSPAADAKTQAHRKKVIATFIQLGYFTKIVLKDNLPHAHATPAFMAFPRKDKVGLAATIFAYHNDEDPARDKLIIVLAGSGKKVGVFSKTGGGLRMTP